MSGGVLLTGGAGFLARHLLERLVGERPADTRWFLLVEPTAVFVAGARLAALEARQPGLAGRWHVVPGRVERADLGLADAARAALVGGVDEVWHLPGGSVLDAPEAWARRELVTATEHLLDLCERLPRLRALHHVSACAVSGDRTGRVHEDELDAGQSFPTACARARFEGEVAVRRRADRLPVRVFRTGLLGGYGPRGEIDAGEPLAVLLGALRDLPAGLPVPRLGPSAARFDALPVDEVVDAMVRLADDPRAAGGTFHLVDPVPLPLDEALELAARGLGRSRLPARLPRRLAEALLPPGLLGALTRPVVHDTSRASALLADVRPPFPTAATWLPSTVDHLRLRPPSTQEAA